MLAPLACFFLSLIALQVTAFDVLRTYPFEWNAGHKWPIAFVDFKGVKGEEAIREKLASAFGTSELTLEEEIAGLLELPHVEQAVLILGDCTEETLQSELLQSISAHVKQVVLLPAMENIDFEALYNAVVDCGPLNFKLLLERNFPIHIDALDEVPSQNLCGAYLVLQGFLLFEGEEVIPQEGFAAIQEFFAKSAASRSDKTYCKVLMYLNSLYVRDPELRKRLLKR